MKTQKDYWDGRILDWETTVFGGQPSKPLPFIEKVAQHFRGPIRHRQLLARDLLDRRQPKRLLELGCGSGRFATAMAMVSYTHRVTGVDISGPAIQTAQQNAAAAKLTAKRTFVCSSISELDIEALKPLDFVVGLGLTPYLTESEFHRLFSAIKDTSFFFDVHPKRLSVQNMAHTVYRAIKGHPFYHRYTPTEFLGKLARLGISDVEWKRSQGVWYVQRLGA